MYESAQCRFKPERYHALPPLIIPEFCSSVQGQFYIGLLHNKIFEVKISTRISPHLARFVVKKFTNWVSYSAV